MKNKITPCLWFDGDAEDAANFYVSVFPDSKISSISHYGEAGKDAHGQTPGSVMVVAFELNGQSFTGLNGRAPFQFSESVSFQIECETQDEVDHYWEKLSAHPDSEMCGWLKDKFGLSWQVVPRILPELLASPEAGKSRRAMEAMLRMKKLDIAALQHAFAG